jgi:DNA invertase Pin-like site-specific DNA recombinase
LYARVSTTDQTCEMQLRELREYAARRGWEIAGGEYVDTGWSGAKASRPELDRLMQDARMRLSLGTATIRRYSTITAVPLMLTMSMPLFWPSTS